MSQKLRFAKMHGLGNDFMVVDAINQAFVPDPALLRRWADRFSGIGFDQLLTVEKPDSDEAAFKYRIYNADGGEVSQCGNGARCFARFVRDFLQNLYSYTHKYFQLEPNYLQRRRVPPNHSLLDVSRRRYKSTF